MKCYAVYGSFTGITINNTQIVIQEIAQPYYFNYFKDSISSKILFSGSADTKGTEYTLLVDITKYDHLIVHEGCLYNGSYLDRTQIRINVSDIKGAPTEFMLNVYASSTYNYFVEFGIINGKIVIYNKNSIGWPNAGIFRVDGVGYNYDNPYQDIITTSPDAALTDAQVDSDITTIWSGVGL
jgi:hypothetical protein